MIMTMKHDLAFIHGQHQAIAIVYNIIRELAANKKDIISTTSCRGLSINDCLLLLLTFYKPFSTITSGRKMNNPL